MLKSFRNLTKSRFGLIAVFVFLGIIAIAFAASDLSGITGMSGGGRSNVVAKVGGTKITDTEVRERVDRFLRGLQRDGQNVTMEQFLAQGGLELAIDEMINATALVEFADDSGMQVSKKLIDGEIASTPAFFGIDGKFNQQAFERLLADNRLSPAEFRDGMTRDRYGSWLLNRATLGAGMPKGVALPYASMMLERRTGMVGLVSTIAMDPGADPDDKTLTAYYNSHRNRYMVPERRVVRYAEVRPDALKAQAAATEAEIADAYKKAGDRFAAKQKRTVHQLIVLDQASANRIAAEVKGGKSIAAAASAAGLEPTDFAGVEKNELARQTSQAIADAAFAAAQGSAVGPIRSALGWHVLQVEKIENVAAKTLAEAHDTLADEISQRKTAQALADLRQQIEDGIGEGKTFDEAVRDAKLTAQATPALTAAGANPEDESYKPDPALAPIIGAGFAFERQEDEPQIVPISQEGAFALVKLERIVPAAPRPLAQIRDKVKTDYLVDQALQKARTAAAAVVAKLEKGVPMAQALAEAGVHKGPPPKPFDLKRSELQGKENFIRMAFSMEPKKAKLVEAEDRKGYYVVYLDAVEQHDASGDPVLTAQIRSSLEQQAGPELAREFVRAIRNQVKVSRDEAAIKRLREDLLRTGAR